MRTYEITEEVLPATATAVCTATLTVPEIGAWISRTYGTIAGVLASQGVEPAGPPFARYRAVGGNRFHVEAGFPVPAPIAATADVYAATLPGGPVARTVHVGPYGDMEPAYEALTDWIRDRGGTPSGEPREIYLSDPASQPDPATWRTEIVQPYRAARREPAPDR